MEIHPEELFSAPGGWEDAKYSVLNSLVFLGLYAYSELRYDGGLDTMLAIGVAVGVAGITELLPTNRRLLASVLRVVAIGSLVALLLRSVFIFVS
ncbi:hypothetical protein [Halorussus salinus]|uniref:hypothetical protein n=1 Tax=Halorussus salinus TaxID=1364935 RepID=UPI001091DE57|nr:hypothetical protein [Halorussus salinus]